MERDDDWSTIILGRIEFAGDLHVVDAIYHQMCCVNFRTYRKVPKKYFGSTIDVSKFVKSGRPENSKRSLAFSTVISHLETCQQQVTLVDLVKKMEECLKDTEETAYSVVYMKSCLEQHYGERLIISTIKGKHSVITLRETADSILHNFYQTPMSDNPGREKAN